MKIWLIVLAFTTSVWALDNLPDHIQDKHNQNKYIISEKICVDASFFYIQNVKRSPKKSVYIEIVNKSLPLVDLFMETQENIDLFYLQLSHRFPDETVCKEKKKFLDAQLALFVNLLESISFNRSVKTSKVIDALTDVL